MIRSETARAFADWRAMSPVEAVTAAYDRLDAYGDRAMFITVRDRTQALDLAAQLEADGAEGKPLFGLPFAVKDNIDVAGMPTTAACPAAKFTPSISAYAVAKLEAAGAICIGKTNLDQFATGLVGVRSPYGVPRNSQRADLVPGGSSSGSAVAVGAGIVAFALGTDTAGSGRVPAAMNAIVGLKPSLGLLSASGMIPACRTLDTISIFAANTVDAAEATSVAQGYDAADFLSRALPAASPVTPVWGTITVGVPRDEDRHFFGDDLAKAAFEADLKSLEALGATIKPIDFEPFYAVARLLYEGPWVAERYHAVRRLIESTPDALHPVTRGIISGASSISAVDTFDAIYKLADLRRSIEPILGELDCLAVPSIPTVYSVEELVAEPVQLNSNLGTYTNFVNLLDLAAISVPVGDRADGLSSSLTLIAQAGQDAFIAGIASALEGNTADGEALGARPGDVLLAVVGAHLTGMPLNEQLTSRNARLVAETTTAPDYTLYALDGTVPPKPGLCRVAEGHGASIIVEVWSLSEAAFGSFVNDVPPPLGIGTVRLASGQHVNGFIAEGIALEGAVDITAHGGWRAYRAAVASSSAA
ncbi:MAG: allophanate hydrolase [Pseudomonadota bacterium]